MFPEPGPDDGDPVGLERAAVLGPVDVLPHPPPLHPPAVPTLVLELALVRVRLKIMPVTITSRSLRIVDIDFRKPSTFGTDISRSLFMRDDGGLHSYRY